MKREPKSERGGRTHPLPVLLLAPLFSRSLTLVPRSFRLNRTETLATQATRPMVERELRNRKASLVLFARFPVVK